MFDKRKIKNLTSLIFTHRLLSFFDMDYAMDYIVTGQTYDLIFLCSGYGRSEVEMVTFFKEVIGIYVGKIVLVDSLYGDETVKSRVLDAFPKQNETFALVDFFSLSRFLEVRSRELHPIFISFGYQLAFSGNNLDAQITYNQLSREKISELYPNVPWLKYDSGNLDFFNPKTISSSGQLVYV